MEDILNFVVSRALVVLMLVGWEGVVGVLLASVTVAVIGYLVGRLKNKQ
jgi:hypothetical protein